MAELVRSVLFNPCSTSGARLHELAEAFGNEDALGLVGTERRRIDHDITTQRSGRWTFWHWGYRPRAVGTDTSCGISVGLGPRLCRAARRVYARPPALAGRAGGLRVRTATKNLLILAFDMLPRRTHRESVYNAAVDGLVTWLDKCCRRRRAALSRC